MTYQNFYMRDYRTPETYYEDKDVPKQEPTLEKLKGKLDDLVAALQALQAKRKPSPAHKEILNKEIDKAEIQRYKQQSKQFAANVIEELIHGTSDDALDAITEALEYKIFCRVEPYMVETGDKIEGQVFRDQ